jgi:WD40 repeat protein
MELWIQIHMSYFSEGRFATISTRNELVIYDLDTLSRVPLPHKIRGHVCCLAPRRDFVVVAAESTLRLVNMDTCKVTSSLPQARRILNLLCSPTGTELYTTSGYQIDKWDISDGLRFRSSATLGVAAIFVALNSIGRHLVACGWLGDIEVWDTAHEVICHRFSIPNSSFGVSECVLYDTYVFTSHQAGLLYRTNLSTLATDVVYKTNHSVLSCAVSRRLYVYMTDRTVTVVDRHTNETVYELSGARRLFCHCSFTPNELYLVIIRAQGRNLVWSVAGHLFRMTT